MPTINQLSIVVPCYNEAACVEETYRRLARLAGDLAKQGIIKTAELIFVDDGSKDATLPILKKITAADHTVKAIALSRNFGHQSALTAGLFHARGEAVVSLDADLQDSPAVIAEMLKKFNEGNEIVFGARDDRKTDSWGKKLTAQFFYKLMNLMGANLIYNHADFRLISRRVLEELKHFPESARFLRGLIPSLGFNQATVYYTRDPRFAGRTKYPLGKMTAFAVEGITSFTYFPLRIASFAGIIISLASILLSVWALVTNLLGRAVPGWSSIVLPMYFLGGIQLLFLGIIGEYIGKIYLETKRRPLFIVKDKYNF